MSKKENNIIKSLEQEIKFLQKLLEKTQSGKTKKDLLLLFRSVNSDLKTELEDFLLKNSLTNWNLLDLKNNPLESLKNLLNKINRLSEITKQDSLTGLGNRKSLEETLNLEVERAHRTKQPLCVCFIDLDDFKKINDTMGHDVGDRVLKGVANILKETCRKTDFIFRYGGEELVILFPGTSLYHSEAISERIRTRVKKHRFRDNKNNVFFVSCSMGISCYKGKKLISPMELIKEADKALYQAKSLGKDRVVVGKIVDLDIEIEEKLKVNSEEKTLLFGKNV